MARKCRPDSGSGGVYAVIRDYMIISLQDNSVVFWPEEVKEVKVYEKKGFIIIPAGGPHVVSGSETSSPPAIPYSKSSS